MRVTDNNCIRELSWRKTNHQDLIGVYKLYTYVIRDSVAYLVDIEEWILMGCQILRDARGKKIFKIMLLQLIIIYIILNFYNKFLFIIFWEINSSDNLNLDKTNKSICTSWF